MKRKVKKYAGGTLVDSSGNPVRSSSGEPVRTRFGRDDEDRPKSNGVEDYASMGKRASAVSPFSGPKEYISESSTEDVVKEPMADTEEPRRKISDYISNKSTSTASEDKEPAVKKKADAKKKIYKYEDTQAKIGSQGNFNIDQPKDTSRGLRLVPGSIAEKIANKVSGALDRSQQVGTNAMKESARQARVDRLHRNVGTNQELYGMKKGGKVKKYADGGMTQQPTYPFYGNQPQAGGQNGGMNQTFNMQTQPAFKKGGKVSSASSRADGCAIRGKTRA